MLSFDLTMMGDCFVAQVGVAAYGTYNATGGDSWVDLHGTGTGGEQTYLSVAQIGGPLSGGSPMATTPGVGDWPIYGDANSYWTGQAGVDTSGWFPTLPYHVEFSAYLEAFGGSEGGAGIDMTTADNYIVISVIPEPATLSLLCIGALALIRRR